MPISRDRLVSIRRLALIGANVLVLIGLVATAVLVRLEAGWVTPVFRDNEDAFRHGTIGTEVMPLPVAIVLPTMFPAHFQPAGPQAGDWIEQFGFLRHPDVSANEGLPVGFVISNYRPQSGSPSPVPFVGFSCALCHTTQIRENKEQPGRIVLGPGSISLNLFAWLDAFQASILDGETASADGSADKLAPPPYRLTLDGIADTYRKLKGRELDLAERVMTSLWLREIRGRVSAGLSRFDEPYGHGRSREPELVPTGPTRTQPFRTLIRSVLERPGNDMPVYSKIATIFSQDMRQRAQFDGTIADLNARSALAALAAGATVANMALPEISHNIRKASEYSKTLRSPSYDDLFPEHAVRRDSVRASRGRGVYRQYCVDCHGDRDMATGRWVNGARTNTVVPVAEIKTDAERVMFRHYGQLADRMFGLFPLNHPFHFPRGAIWPQPGEEDDVGIRGYVNGPIDGAFLRAPYLHNGSVLTLAELINLKKRRDVFYRGRNTYDPVDVGYRSPAAADAETYFKFDSAVRGNSNKGHDYPWAYDDPRRNPDDLAALLEYLKTL